MEKKNKNQLELPKYINYELTNDIEYETISKVVKEFNASLESKAELVCNRFELSYWSMAIKIEEGNRIPSLDETLALGIYIGNLLNKYKNK